MHDRKAVLIIRVSDPRQEREGLSMDNQEVALKEYAANLGFIIERQFRFQESADYKLRKNFQQMVAFVKKHGDVPIIIGYRVDRLTRNYHDHVLLDDLRLNHGKELHFVHDRLVISQRSVGREITEWDTKVYLAKSYLNRLKEDAYMTLAFKLSRGEWPGKSPFGYRNIRVLNRAGMELREPQCLAVQRAFSLYSSGAFSMEQVRQKVNEEFSLKLSKGNIDHILRNTFYFGEMKMHGKSYPHIHPVLISRRAFEKVTWVRASHGKTPYKYAGLDFPYRGLIVCADCGCRITPERKLKRGQTYNYYHCTQYRGKHDAVWLREEQITELVNKTLQQLKIPDEWVGPMIQRIEMALAKDIQVDERLRIANDAEVLKLERRLDRLYEDRLDGVITIDEYTAKASDYRNLIRSTKSKCQAPLSAGSQRVVYFRKFMDLCRGASEAFGSSENSEKRQILKLTFQNLSIAGGKLLLEPRSPFNEVLQCAESKNWLRLEDTLSNVSFEELFENQVVDLVQFATTQCKEAS